MSDGVHWRPDGSGVCLCIAWTYCEACGWACSPAYDKMIARTQDGPDPLVPEPGPGSTS
jgi:hypothetical protein